MDILRILLVVGVTFSISFFFYGLSKRKKKVQTWSVVATVLLVASEIIVARIPVEQHVVMSVDSVSVTKLTDMLKPAALPTPIIPKQLQVAMSPDSIILDIAGKQVLLQLKFVNRSDFAAFDFYSYARGGIDSITVADSIETERLLDRHVKGGREIRPAEVFWDKRKIAGFEAVGTIANSSAARKELSSYFKHFLAFGGYSFYDGSGANYRSMFCFRLDIQTGKITPYSRFNYRDRKL
jgi:hypothetical protein